MPQGQHSRHSGDGIAHEVEQRVHAMSRRFGGQDGSRLRRPGRLRVGVDSTSVDGVADSLARFGERYVRRVFTPGEGAYCKAAGGRRIASRFAARFAAKEAALKVLRPDTLWTDWRSIEVRRHASGWCELVLHGGAAALAERQRITSLALSLTHARDCVVAVVIGQEEGSAGEGRGLTCQRN